MIVEFGGHAPTLRAKQVGYFLVRGLVRVPRWSASDCDGGSMQPASESGGKGRTQHAPTRDWVLARIAERRTS
eukprot:3082708-Rhodomonas_salina.2